MSRVAPLVDALVAQAWNAGRFDALRALAAPVVTFHYRGQAFATDVEQLQGLVASWRAAFPDLHLEVLDVVAADDLVALRLRVSGTHLGTWQGTAATGRTVAFDEMLFLRIDDGLLAEVWEVQDELAMLEQLGAVAR